MVGILKKVPSTTNTTIHKHHHHGGAVCPSYGVGLMDLSDLTQVTSSKGVRQGCCCRVLYKSINEQLNRYKGSGRNKMLQGLNAPKASEAKVICNQ
jgi:hypothetical protein